MHTILKFSYFLLLLFLISCGEKVKKQVESTTTESVIDDNSSSEETTAKNILFFGNSLTAGMGLDIKDAFPAIIQNKIDSLQLDYAVINAGLSGETTASGKNRLPWVLNQKVDIFILELGANDGLRGIPLEETRNNLQAIIETVQEKNPNTKIILAGMQIPPNMGKAYTSEFKNIFPELAKKNGATLIPFLLDNVAGNPELNQEDGIHPTVAGQKIVANNVWAILKEIVVR
ncbi:MAG: arylesterase [Maribacter sp.]|nr:arylesterase [Maribacter sp.]NNK19021.1 arylesterase [Maribacter sp.]NNK76388.1 arylesterase [Maribacter sp.]